ncbi:glycosyltransferase [Pseudolysinimonas yzui]|nr:glycosyltransferase [Pseudolysinimonas yzui]
MRMLVATFDAGGNMPPMSAIARELAERGHDVTMLLEPHQTAPGLEARPYATPFRPRRPRSQLGAAIGLSRVFADRRLAAEILELARREEADAVVVDCLLVATVNTLAAAGIRTISVVHTPWSFLRDAARGPFGVIIRLLGGGDAAASLDAPEAVLVTSARELDGDAAMPEHVHHVGPVDRLPHPGTPAAGAPLVVVSLSTTPNPGQERTLQAIADALGELPVRGLLSGGGLVETTALRLPDNVDAAPWIDHDAVLPTAALLVGHGGHGTTVRALAAGVPVLALPVNPLGDQPGIAKALARLGIGSRLSRSASPARIRREIQRLLGDAATRQRVATFGARLHHARVASATEIIEGVAAAR